MRITTQMMHASAKRAGISLGGTSLLNYINKDSGQSTQNVLLNALNTKQAATINKSQSKSHKELETAADSLTDSVRSFLTGGEDNIFQKAEEDKGVLTDAAKCLIVKYNAVVKALKNASNPLNDFYREMLDEVVTESEKELSAIGITKKENGTLVFEEEKFEDTDISTVKRVLDGNGLFSTKMAFLASRICDNAKVNAESYSSQYSADGYSYVTNSSRYEFWG